VKRDINNKGGYRSRQGEVGIGRGHGINTRTIMRTFDKNKIKKTFQSHSTAVLSDVKGGGVIDREQRASVGV
jgi:hypothetical protein